MTLLSDMFREEVSKSKDMSMCIEATTDVGYPTGFANFDFMNGYIQTVNNEVKGLHEEYYSLGIANGSFVMVIGRSGCGKSTFCEQIAANIIRPFKSSCIFEDSTEALSATWQRREMLTGYYGDELKQRYIIRDKGITAENFYERIKMIHDMKMAHKEQFTYDTGKLDSFGNSIIMFEPTVYILDSVALLMPKNVLEQDELGGTMSTTAGAKVVTQVFRGIIQMLKAANIILIAVNHILDDVSITGRPKKPSIAYLKPGETLPKGKTIIYLANTIIRLDDVTKLKGDEKYKVWGSLVEATLVKSRSARSNQKTTLLFNHDTGFDPVLSSLIFMQQNTDRIHGAGIGLYLDDHKDMKFSMGNFKEKMKNNEEFFNTFTAAYIEELKKIPEANTVLDTKANTRINEKVMDLLKL